MRDIREKNWFWLENDLVDREDLKPMERLLYMVLARHSDNKSGESFPSEDTLCVKTGVKDKRTVRTYIESLEKKGLISVKRQLGKSNRYFLKSIKIVVKNEDIEYEKEGTKNVVTKNDTSNKICKKPVTNFAETSNKICHSNYTNKNTNIKTTTTKLNYIYPIDNPNKKNSSSSISEEINELKKYLMQEIHDIPTCKNIMFLVENRDLNLERIKTVVEYSKKNKKGNGYIYSALENNWDIPGDNIKNNFISSLDKEKEFIEKRQFERMEVEKQKLTQVELTPELEKELIEKAVLIDKISKGFLVTMKTKNKIMYENMLKKYLD